MPSSAIMDVFFLLSRLPNMEMPQINQTKPVKHRLCKQALQICHIPFAQIALPRKCMWHVGIARSTGTVTAVLVSCRAVSQSVR